MEVDLSKDELRLKLLEIIYSADPQIKADEAIEQAKSLECYLGSHSGQQRGSEGTA